MDRRFLLVALFATLSVAPARAAVIHVPTDHPTIQAAIDASSPGDEILVDPGTYAENLVVTSPQAGITIRSTGGSAVTTITAGGSGTVLTCGPSPLATEIDGFTITGGNTFVPGGAMRLVAATLVLRNLVVADNRAVAGGGIYADGGSIDVRSCVFRGNDGYAGSGGAIYLDHFAVAIVEDSEFVGNLCPAYGAGWSIWEGSSLTARRNRIEGSVAGLRGGAFFVLGSYLNMSECVIVGNEAQNGGGGWFEFSTGTIESSEFRGNQAVGAGGALLIDETSAVNLTGNRFVENKALTGSGGGVYFDHHANGTVERNLFLRNECPAFGGAVSIWQGGYPTLRNNTLVANRAGLGGGGVYVTQGSFPICQANIVAFNEGGGITIGDPSAAKSFTCDNAYGNTGGDWVGVPSPVGVDGNQSSDPRFCDMPTDDYRLQTNSPCAPGNSPAGCGLVGAFDPNCGPTSAERASWGRIKTRYR